MSQTIADVFVEHLVHAGVQRIYGIVGDSLNPVVDAVRRNGKLQWIHVRHEEEAAFAAGAEAQLSGNLAACAGSCGPGNVHLINGLYDAHRSNAPVLALAAQIPSHEIGTMYFQETHPERLFQECSYYCELISNPGQMPRALQIAIQTAMSKQGVAVVVLPGDIAALPMPNDAISPGRTTTATPCLLMAVVVLPGDIAALPMPNDALVHAPVTQRPIIRPSDASIAQLAGLLNAAQKVTLFCGS